MGVSAGLSGSGVLAGTVSMPLSTTSFSCATAALSLAIASKHFSTCTNT